MKKKIIIGTRGSKLAVTQTHLVMSQLQAAYPELTFQTKIINTRGDEGLNSRLLVQEGYGFFVKEIEDALLSKDIDIAVHSLKDMPAVLPDGLKIGAICKRLDARDVFISKDGCSLEDLEQGSGIGTSSLRRRIQLQSFRPDLRVVDLRGNLDTRLMKLSKDSEISGIIVAAAGLYRLNLEEKITQFLPIDPFLPAAGQGALAVEVREQDEEEALVMVLEDKESRLVVSAERAFLEKIGIGCDAPVGVHAEIVGERLIVRGMVSNHWEEVEGAQKDCRELGLLLGERMVVTVHGLQLSVHG
ncbi:hydroxymethylbilane synthase [Candidatus Desantisbacteria bacterium]|nr:hydroxymethylbilane synthase [Candidatus Desantisbacteria bacterium]